MEHKSDGVLHGIVEAFTNGEFDAIAGLVQQGLDVGVSADSLLNDGLIVGIREVGEQFRRFEVYLPEMMMAADAWEEGMGLLEPVMTAQGTRREPIARVVIGAVKGDIHSLGKNMVVTLMTASMIDALDLGVDVPASKFIDEAEKVGAHVIALSALMTTTMPQQREVIEHLYARGLRDKYFVMVGGGPTTAEWAKEIDADAYGETAASAVNLVLSYMEQRS
jgi:corrinoid protein of di/trimethylamine methyltransferase